MEFWFRIWIELLGRNLISPFHFLMTNFFRKNLPIISRDGISIDYVSWLFCCYDSLTWYFFWVWPPGSVSRNICDELHFFCNFSAWFLEFDVSEESVWMCSMYWTILRLIILSTVVFDDFWHTFSVFASELQFIGLFIIFSLLLYS